MDFFESIEFLILGDRIVIKRKKMIYFLSDEGVIVRDIEKKIIIISFDDRSIFFISENCISFGT